MITDGLEFPEGPVWMPDGSVLVAELHGPARHARRARRDEDDRRRTRREPERAGDRSRRRVYVANSGGWSFMDLGGILIPEAEQPRRLQRRPHRARRPRLGRREGALHRVRRQRARRPERSRVRRARRLLLHRSRQAPRPRPHHRRDLLRAAPTARRSAKSCSRPTRRTASACRRTARVCTRPRRTPAACTRGRDGAG